MLLRLQGELEQNQLGNLNFHDNTINLNRTLQQLLDLKGTVTLVVGRHGYTALDLQLPVQESK